MVNITTLDPLDCPVIVQDLADWARLDSDDPKMETSILIATGLAISFLSLDLLKRTWTLTHDDWPVVGTTSGSKLSRPSYSANTRVDLLYANLISIESVKVNGELLKTDDYRVIKGKPDQLEFQTFSSTSSYFKEDPAIEVVYVAGYETYKDVPNQIRQAILMCAAHIHSHSGGCDVNNALKDSGASALLVPFAVNAGMVF